MTADERMTTHVCQTSGVFGCGGADCGHEIEELLTARLSRERDQPAPTPSHRQEADMTPVIIPIRELEPDPPTPSSLHTASDFPSTHCLFVSITEALAGEVGRTLTLSVFVVWLSCCLLFIKPSLNNCLPN